MKKLIGCLIILFALFMPTITTHAAEDSWFFSGTNTKIFGGLYFYNGVKDEANASTTNRSENNVKVLVKLYATDNGQTISGSWKESRDYPKSWTCSAARKPDWWGSIHSTTPTNDPYECLNIYAGL